MIFGYESEVLNFLDAWLGWILFAVIAIFYFIFRDD